ncbi:MAG: hypothetical protein QOJ64_1946 [Acidobacteriota bacterium]|jgi:hypothetical protein|nr:hypothetical protein [Acidobacteriota bacterium]
MLYQQKILGYLQEGVRSWDQLRSLLRVNDDRLGFMILTLLNERKIWTAQKKGVRVYGLERRSGIAPRAFHPERRSPE